MQNHAAHESHTTMIQTSQLRAEMHFWASKLGGRGAGVDGVGSDSDASARIGLDLLQHASMDWLLPFEMTRGISRSSRNPRNPRNPRNRTASVAQSQEQLLASLFLAFLPDAYTGYAGCSAPVMQAAGSKWLRGRLGVVFQALLVEVVRVVCALEAKNYHMLALNSRALLVGGDDSLRWLAPVLSKRWKSQMMFLSLDLVKRIPGLTARPDVKPSEVATDLKKLQDVLQLDAGLRLDRERFKAIFLLPLGVLHGDYGGYPEPSQLLMPVFHYWLRGNARNRVNNSQLVYGLLTYVGRQEKPCHHTSPDQAMANESMLVRCVHCKFDIGRLHSSATHEIKRRTAYFSTRALTKSKFDMSPLLAGRIWCTVGPPFS